MKNKPTKEQKNTDSTVQQNFGLTEDAFNEMLQNMKAGNDALFEQIFLAQFQETITYLMRRYKVNQSMAYDATMDALLKFRKRLLAGKIGYKNMRFLFTQMAGQFLTTALKKDNKLVAITAPDDRSEEEVVFDDIILDTLDDAWQLLGDQCKSLLENYYYKKIALKELAQKLGKSDAALRKQKQRCLEALRYYFLKKHKR